MKQTWIAWVLLGAATASCTTTDPREGSVAQNSLGTATASTTNASRRLLTALLGPDHAGDAGHGTFWMYRRDASDNYTTGYASLVFQYDDGRPTHEFPIAIDRGLNGGRDLFVSMASPQYRPSAEQLWDTTEAGGAAPSYQAVLGTATGPAGSIELSSSGISFASAQTNAVENRFDLVLPDAVGAEAHDYFDLLQLLWGDGNSHLESGGGPATDTACPGGGAAPRSCPLEDCLRHAQETYDQVMRDAQAELDRAQAARDAAAAQCANLLRSFLNTSMDTCGTGYGQGGACALACQRSPWGCVLGCLYTGYKLCVNMSTLEQQKNAAIACRQNVLAPAEEALAGAHDDFNRTKRDMDFWLDAERMRCRMTNPPCTCRYPTTN